MIKKKKVIRVRRNPVDKDFFDSFQFNDLHSSLYFAYFEDLSDLLIIYHQSNFCEDCNKYSDECECEYCEDCELNRCLCMLKDLSITDENSKGRIVIRKIVWEFIRYFNFKKQDVKKYIIPDKWLIEEFYENKQITKKEANFLESLTPSTKFPEYTSIMKRLFEID